MLRVQHIRKKILYAAFIVCLLFFIVNFYLLNLQKNELLQATHILPKGFGVDQEEEKKAGEHQLGFFNGTNHAVQNIVDRLVQVTQTCVGCHTDVAWNITYGWLTARQVHPEAPPLLGGILTKMATAKITQVRAAKGGTQLKLFLWLEGGQKVVFKPQRFSRDHVINGEPYAGADRHNGEIAAFHLNRLLSFRRGPIVTGRKINLKKEIIPVAETNLLKTFLKRENFTCFYGICHYCNPLDAVCGDGNDDLEGALILWLPPFVKLKAHHHPWSRTYRKGVKALWETHDDFCNSVKVLPLYNSSLLLDVIDASIFDFLISNADRHRYEVLDNIKNSMLLLLDNGKSFGNPFLDEVSILAPLYQCCRIRQTTWEKLLLFEKDALGSAMKTILKLDPLNPVLNDYHLGALNRRLEKIKFVVDKCILQYKKNYVIVANEI